MKMHTYLQNKPLFVFDGFTGAEKASKVSFRIVNEYAYQNMFIHQLLICPTDEELETFKPVYTVICAPGFSCIPEFDGVNSETAIVIDFESKTVLIAGNLYCGEIKKAVFTVMNYVLPRRGILTMHCSANTDENGNTALFFGLSGTGKTTLALQGKRSENLAVKNSHLGAKCETAQTKYGYREATLDKRYSDRIR